MGLFTIILVIIIFLWAFFTAVQAKMNQSVKQIYREFQGKGEVYFGKTPGYKLTLPHVVAIVCCDKKGIILNFRYITIHKVRGQPDISDWSEMKGRDIHTLNPSDYPDKKHIVIALDKLIKNYQKYNPKAQKRT